MARLRQEAMGEKIPASFQRNKIRDLHDLQQLQEHHSSSFDRDLVRKLTVLKFWESPEASATFAEFSYETFDQRLRKRAENKEFNEADLKSLLHKAAKVELSSMVDAVSKTYSLLADLTEEEKVLVSDRHQKETKLYEQFREAVRVAASLAPAAASKP